jgi:2-polyprenyl-6-methoxyphenol hydroxylase-like FAD-dependent oxidoreductase
MTARHAVVIGGSLAGLCAGRVLSKFFAKVTVVDRDSYPVRAQDRAGVPQGRHVHALLARGRQELERLFPGFDPLMLEQGAIEIDFGLDFATLRPDGWARREASGIRTLFASRSLIESVVRGLFRKLPNVELLEQSTVTGVTANHNGYPHVTEVQVSARNQDTHTKLTADLVVDASGRTTKAPEWLRTLGLEPPEETVVDSFAGYSTRWFKAPEPAHWPQNWWWKGIWIDLKEPEHMIAGVLFPVEQGRWIVTIAGMAKHYPPSDEDGFTAALTQLRSPILAEAVRTAEPISSVYCNRAMANRFRHYDRWKARLGGFVAVGDAVCSFNPVYGQGMTTAAVSATILQDCLNQTGPTSPDLPRKFFRAQTRFQRDPWAMATGADLRFPQTEGQRPLRARLVGPYMDALFLTAREDVLVRRRLGEVINLLRPLSAFFAPSILSRVAMNSLRRRLVRNQAEVLPIPALPPA